MGQLDECPLRIQRAEGREITDEAIEEEGSGWREVGMVELNELKQFISNYKSNMEYARKKLDAPCIDFAQLHINGDKVYKLSKEFGLKFKLEKRNCYDYPFEISLMIDDFKLYGLLTWEYAKNNKLTKKCPTCGSKI